MHTLIKTGAALTAAVLAFKAYDVFGNAPMEVEEYRWTPPTVEAGLDGGLLLASHNAPPRRFAFGPAGARTEVAPPTISTQALYHFAAAGNNDLLTAEYQRLREKHPTFYVDFNTLPRGEEEGEKRLWQDLGAGDTEGLSAEISRRKSRRPAYEPSAELRRAVANAHARDQMAAAEAARDHARVVMIAETNPQLMTCDNVPFLWSVAEALAHTGRTGVSRAAFAFILDDCATEAERVATVQKAAAVLPAADAEALATRLDDAAVEAVRVGLHRGTIGAWLDHHTKKRADRCPARADAYVPGTRTTTADAAQVAADALAKTPALPEDAKLLGWYFVSLDRPADAENWFRKAQNTGAGLEAVEGLMAALMEGARPFEAFAVGEPHAEGDRRFACLTMGAAAMSLPLAQDPRPYAAFLEKVAGGFEDAGVAGQLGWHKFNVGEYAAAKPWFERSLKIAPSDAAATGLALVHIRLGKKGAVKGLAKRYGKGFATLSKLAHDMRPRAVPRKAPRYVTKPAPQPVSQAELLMRSATVAFQRREWLRAIAFLDQRKALVGEGRNLRMMRAWALHNGKQYFHAVNAFTALNREHSTDETREGLFHSRRELHNIFN
ncbi:MAG: hypothetical protein AAF318_03135 [Pseudomonadota bacterium]